MKKKWILLALVLAVAAVLLYISLTQELETPLAEVEIGDISQEITETGYVETVETFPLEAVQYAKVSAKMVRVGDWVKAGQELLQLENLDLQTELESVRTSIAQMNTEIQTVYSDLESSKAELEREQQDLERSRRLFEAGALSEVEFDQSQNSYDDLVRQYDQRQNYLNSLQLQLNAWEDLSRSVQRRNSQLLISSAVDGTVLDLPVEVGQVLAPGQLIARLGSADALQVRTEILSDDLGEVEVGLLATITAAVMSGKDVKGKVEKIYPQAYEKVSALGVLQRRVPVIIALENNENLKPGYEVLVKIETNKKENTMLLPRAAVTMTRDGEYRVMLVQEGRVINTAVETGLKNQDYIEIISPLKPNDLVVRDGSLELKDNTRIKI